MCITVLIAQGEVNSNRLPCQKVLLDSMTSEEHYESFIYKGVCSFTDITIEMSVPKYLLFYPFSIKGDIDNEIVNKVCYKCPKVNNA